MPKRQAQPDPRCILIAETDPSWRLFHRPWADAGVWHSLYLHRTGRKRDGVHKRSYWLAWNGERLQRNRDAGVLKQHDPDILDWVEAECITASWTAEPAAKPTAKARDDRMDAFVLQLPWRQVTGSP